jgi:Uma2 family endonuclease
MAQPARYYFNPEEYFRQEENSVDKHEFINGEIFLMAGGSPRHNALTANVSAEVVIGLRGKPCTTYSSDMRISAGKGSFYSYADVSVVCGEPEFVEGRKDTITNPILIVEVLSPSTENYDRGKKAELYRNIPSVQSYVLVDQARVYVEHFRRMEEGNWLLETLNELSQVLKIPALNLLIPLTSLYDKIQFEG